MGLLDGFRRRAEQRGAEKAERARELAWQRAAEERADLTEMIEVAKEFRGLTASDVQTPIQLKKTERVFMIGAGAALIEPRKGQGHYEGGYSGVSFRVMKGVRYHTGSSRGRYVSGPEVPTPVDDGTVVITSQRVVFHGTKLAREWNFAKLLAVQHDSVEPWTSLPVSNRQKVSGILYDHDSSTAFRFRLALALAHYNEAVPAFIAGLERELQQLQANPQLEEGRP